jgi:hypothetical protein
MILFISENMYSAYYAVYSTQYSLLNLYFNAFTFNFYMLQYSFFMWEPVNNLILMFILRFINCMSY